MWIVKFLPQFAQEKIFLKLSKHFLYESKPFNSDRMNQNAINNKDAFVTDMLFYFNIMMSSEEQMTEFIQYDMVDVLSFTGGFIDIIILVVIVFFWLYNYRLNEAKMMQEYELYRATFEEGDSKHTEISQLIADNEMWISQILFYQDAKKNLINFKQYLTSCCNRGNSGGGDTATEQ